MLARYVFVIQQDVSHGLRGFIVINILIMLQKIRVFIVTNLLPIKTYEMSDTTAKSNFATSANCKGYVFIVVGWLFG